VLYILQLLFLYVINISKSGRSGDIFLVMVYYAALVCFSFGS